MSGAVQPLPTPPPMSFGEMANAMLHDRRRIAATFILTVLAALLAGLVLPARYPARATLLVLLGPEYTVQPEAGGPEPAADALDRQQILLSEAGILASDDLHLAVLRRIGIARLYPRAFAPPGPLDRLRAAAQDLVRRGRALLGESTDMPVSTPEQRALVWFDRALDIAPVKEGSIIDVSFRDRDPALAAEVVNTLVALYLQRRHEVYADPQSSVVRHEAQALRERLDEAADAVAAFRAAHGITDLAAERDLLLHRRAGLIGARQTAESDAAALAGQLDALKRALAATPASVTQYSDIDYEARTAAARTGIEMLREKRDGLRTHYLPSSRPMQDIDAQLAAQEGDLARLRADRAASSTRVGRNPVWDALDLDRQRLAAERAAAEARSAAVAGQIATADAALATLDADEVALQRLQRAEHLAEEAWHSAARIAEQRRLVEDVQARKTANVRVLQSARVPVQAVSFVRPMLAAGVILGLAASALVAIASEFLRTGFIAPAALERRLRVPVLACLPEVVSK